MDILALDYNKELLKKFPSHHDVWKYMLWCTETPRGSLNTSTFVKKMKEHAEKNLKLETVVDDAGNLLIRKPGSKGYENLPAVCLQGHSDMVCTSTGIEWDAKKDPVKALIDGEWLTADRTSLGSDNGIGIAAAFALLENKDAKHPPLEVLVTNDEEIGLIGAANLGAGLLKAKKLINLDSEEEYAICVGCAGGFNADYSLPIKRCGCCCKEGCTPVKVVVEGLKGGHSGVDIELQRASALKWLAKLIAEVLDDGTEVYKIEGGEAHNAIPRSAEAELCVNEASFDVVKGKMEALHKDLAAEVKLIENVSNIKLTVEKIEKAEFEHPLCVESTSKLVELLLVLPSGILRMSPDVKGLVESSAIVAVIKTAEDKVEILCSGRSSRDSQMKDVERYLQALGTLAGAEFKASGHYPGWSPDNESDILGKVKKAYEEVIGKEPKPNIYAIHAGLECGLLRINYPDLDSVSIGPEIKFPHSPDEKILIASVPRFYDLLVKTLELMK